MHLYMRSGRNKKVEDKIIVDYIIAIILFAATFSTICDYFSDKYLVYVVYLVYLNHFVFMLLHGIY